MYLSNILKCQQVLLSGLLLLLAACSQPTQQYNLGDYGLQPGEGQNNSPLMAQALEQIAASYDTTQSCTILLPKGTYHFYPEGAAERVYYISNHDQDNPKRVGLAFENWKNVTFDQPILYAKSVDGLTFQRNAIVQNQDYPAFHWNNHRFLLERVINEKIVDNHFEQGFDPAKDIIKQAANN